MAVLNPKVKDQLTPYLESFSILEKEREKEPHWLSLERKKAFVCFQEMGFPTSQDENWLYLKWNLLSDSTFAPSSQLPSISSQEIEKYALKGHTGPRLVFINGHFSKEFSLTQNLPQGVEISGISEILKSNPEKIEPYFLKIAPYQKNPFTALNSALSLNGIFINFKTQIKVSEPLEILFLSLPQAESLVSYPRVLIHLEKNSEGSVIEHYEGDSQKTYFTNAVSEIYLEEEASLTYTSLQKEGEGAFHVGHVSITQEEKSRFHSNSLTLGGLLSRHDFHANLKAIETESRFNGLYITNANQQMDNNVHVDHLKAHGFSNVFYKGVLGGKSRGVFQGTTVVHKDAQKTDARQTNKNLLLSEEAEADPRPQLEIYANDVKCGHGATVGQLDDNVLFYLRSRGLGETEAKSLLTKAFAMEVVDQMKLPLLNDYCEQALAKLLA